MGQILLPGAPLPGPSPLPAPIPAPVAPAVTTTTPSSPQAPQPDVSWLNQMVQSQGGSAPMPSLSPSALSPSPSPATSGTVMQAIVTKYQAGVTAFQQLTAVHSVFRTQIMATHFMTASDEDNFFYNNSDSLQTLCKLLISVPVQQVLDMISWLESVNGSVSYGPSDWVKLVQKLILRQKVSFPTIELPYRIINFLSKVLVSTVIGSKLADLRSTQDRLRALLYSKMDALSQAQANFMLAVEDANVPPSVTDPIGWASGILQQSTSPQAASIISAHAQIVSAQADLQTVQNQIQDLNEQMASLQNSSLTPDQLAQFLLAHLPSGSDLDQFSHSYQKIKDTVQLYNYLTQPILSQQNQILSQMIPYQTAVSQAQLAFINARTQINYATNTNQTPTQDQVNAFNTASNNLASAQAGLLPFQQKLDSLNQQMQAVMSAHPEFYVTQSDGSQAFVTDPNVLSSLVSQILTQAATDMPSELMSVVQDAMSVDAEAADARTKQIEAEQATLIQAKQDAFQKFYQDQVEAKLQFFRDQMALAQNGYNELNGELTALTDKCQKLQDEINANIEALGQVIGWWCHESNVSEEVMDQSYFISLALNSVMTMHGKYDTVQIPTGSITPAYVSQTFWTGPGSSSQLAGETLTLMGNLDQAKQDYSMKGPGLSAEMNKLVDWMNQLQDSFQITQDLLTSDSCAQSMQPLFAASPQGQIFQEEIDAVVNPLRQISLQVQTAQQTLQAILDDLEKQVLSDNGINISDLGSLTYEKKKSLWVGVCDHLAGPGQRLDELNGYINQIASRLHAGTPQDGDPENMQAAKVALMNIIGAQTVQRTLQKDIDFMSSLHDDAHADYQSVVENTQVAAQATIISAGSGGLS